MRWDYIGNRRNNRLIGEVHLPRISGVYTRGDKARASLITTNSPRLITLLARFTVPWSRIENRALSLSLAGYPPLLLFLSPRPPPLSTRNRDQNPRSLRFVQRKILSNANLELSSLFDDDFPPPPPSVSRLDRILRDRNLLFDKFRKIWPMKKYRSEISSFSLQKNTRRTKGGILKRDEKLRPSGRMCHLVAGSRSSSYWQANQPANQPSTLLPPPRFESCFRVYPDSGEQSLPFLFRDKKRLFLIINLITICLLENEWEIIKIFSKDEYFLIFLFSLYFQSI